MTHSRDLSTRYTKEVAEKGSVGPPARAASAARDRVVPPGSRLCWCRILRTWLLLGYCCGPVKLCLDQSAPRRAFWALRARFASNPIETTIRARGAASLAGLGSLVSTYAQTHAGRPKARMGD